MDLEIKRQLMDVPDLRHRVRQLRWFRVSFRQHAQMLAKHYGLSVNVDETGLVKAYLNWAERFSENRSYAQLDRRDFVVFAAGLLLKELLVLRPVRVDFLPSEKTDTVLRDENWSIIKSWPEGFVTTNYCLCVLAAVLEQEGMNVSLSDVASDLRAWWSYRENVVEDPSRAIAFLDLFIGAKPNWLMPDSVSSRAAMKRALAKNVIPSAAPEPTGA